MIGALVAFAFCVLLVQAGPIDRPRDRGMHRSATPTSGGLAVMAGAAAGAGWTVFSAGSVEIGALLLIGGALGVFGAIDDLWDVGSGLKLAAQAAAALAFALLVARAQTLPFPGFDLRLGFALGVAGTTLWLVVLTNAVNFMDGANGLAPGVQAIAFAAFLFVLPVSEPSWALAFASLWATLAFLGFNLAGRLFQGDVGAFFAAFLIGGLAILAAEAGQASVWFAPTVLAPFLVDVIGTVLVRTRRRARLFEAHREHVYQLWLQSSGVPHLALAWRAWLLSGLCAAFAVAGERAGVSFGAFVAAMLICGGGWLVLRPACLRQVRARVA